MKERFFSASPRFASMLLILTFLTADTSFSQFYRRSPTEAKTSLSPAVTPVLGDIVINEYAADNDANGNDFIEFLTLTDNLDLRGLRFSDNEIVGGVLNNNEAVFIFGNDAYLANVPKGTTIAVWTITAGITPDTTVNPAGGDWKMVLVPGTGVTAGVDGLGGSVNVGFANGGEAFYLYLPGPNGTSAGTDNIYLDFMSFEGDAGDPPAGFADINLPSVADNAYYTGNTAAGNNTAVNWVAYDGAPNASTTPGEANPTQDLSGIRTVAGAPTISENTTANYLDLPAAGPGFLSAVIVDAQDPARITGVDFTVADPDTPVGSLSVTATSSNTAVVTNADLTLTGSGASRNLKINAQGIGYSTITVTVSDGAASASYVINFAASGASSNSAATRWHTGKADASTAIAVDSDYMFVADDEDQTIRLYSRQSSGLPVASFNFTSNLALTDLDGGIPREVDIEASAQAGNRIYWLASHSNSSSGNNRPNRSRLFATDISGSGAAATLTYAGRFDNLKTDMINWDVTNGHGLGANFFGLAASAAPGVIPEEGDGSGFNIEGLVFAPDNVTAYVAFRAPISPATARTKALIVPVTNFAGLVTGNPTVATATFGAPIQLDLGGRGIREIKKNVANEYLIVAGTAGGAADFALYSWTGVAADAPQLRQAVLTGQNPESIVDVPVGLNARAVVQVQLLSDNGDDIFYGDGVIAKELPNDRFKKFRSVPVVVGLSPTAASVSVRGRILSAAGNPIVKARVAVTNSLGQTWTALTNQLGEYQIEELGAGETFVVNVTAKGCSFSPQVLTVTEDVLDLNFVLSP